MNDIMPMQGQGVLTFADGTTLDVTVDLRFTKFTGAFSGRGTVSGDRLFDIRERLDNPVLECGGRRVEVHVATASADGRGSIVTNGSPF